jgi:hypothetical protein
MSFMNFGMLFGLSMIALPVILHLLNKQSSKQIHWGAMQFLKDSVITQKKKILLEDILLLMLRCLLIAVIVMTIARPFISGASNVLSFQTGSDVVFILDGSHSMENQSDQLSHFQKAKKEIDATVRSISEQSDLGLIVAGAQALNKTPTLISNRKSFFKVLENAKTIHGRLDIKAAVNEALDLLETGRHEDKRIVILSDNQRVSWGTADLGAWKALKERLKTFDKKLVVGLRSFELPRESNNLGIEEIYFSREVIGSDRDVDIKINIHNSGHAAVLATTLKLEIGNIKLSKELDQEIEAGASSEVVFKHRFRKPGAILLKASIDYKDDNPSDNQQVKILHVKQRLPLLLVRSPSKNSDIKSILRALNHKEKNSLFSIKIVEAKNLDKIVDLSPYHSVILSDVPKITEQAKKKINRYLKRGGSLLIAAGAHCDKAFYNNWLYQGEALLPGKLIKRKKIKISQPAVTLQPKSLSHEAFAFKSSNERSDFKDALFKNYWIVEAIPDQDSVNLGAAFNTGSAFLLQKQLKNSQVILLSSSLDLFDSSLPKTHFFLPFMHELFYKLCAVDTSFLNLPIQKKIQLHLPQKTDAFASLPKTIEAAVRAPDDSQRKATFTRRENAWLVKVSGDPLPGLYHIAIPQKMAASLKGLSIKDELLFTLHRDILESDLSPLNHIDQSFIRQHLPTGQVTSASQISAFVNNNDFGKEIWQIMALCALAFLVLESLLIRWIAYRRRLGVSRKVSFNKMDEAAEGYLEKIEELRARP